MATSLTKNNEGYCIARKSIFFKVSCIRALVKWCKYSSHIAYAYSQAGFSLQPFFLYPVKLCHVSCHSNCKEVSKLPNISIFLQGQLKLFSSLFNQSKGIVTKWEEPDKKKIFHILSSFQGKIHINSTSTTGQIDKSRFWWII